MGDPTNGRRWMRTNLGQLLLRVAGSVFGRCPSVSVFGCCALPRWHAGEHSCTMGSCRMGPVSWKSKEEALARICVCGKCVENLRVRTRSRTMTA